MNNDARCYFISHRQLEQAAAVAWETIYEATKDFSRTRKVKIYGVPRGGTHAAYLIQHAAYLRLQREASQIVDYAQDADVIVDDMLDSGATKRRYKELFPGKPFVVLVNKPMSDWVKHWLVFPWELGPAEGEETIEDNVVRILQFIGEDPLRGGLVETPKRVVKAWKEWTSGYGLSPADVLKTFEDGADNCDQMVTVRNIPFYSHCEHHMAPFFGTATVAYIPNGRIVGLSKINRLVDMFARRLQVQERMTNQIADAMDEVLQPQGVGVMIRGRHFCMESRGIRHANCDTVTTALRGAMLDKPQARSEFIELCKV